MGIISRLFGNKGQKQAKNTIPISELRPDKLPPDGRVLYSSPIPASLKVANKVYDKEYEDAIKEGLELLEDAPDDPMVHINLMMAYFKARNLNQEFFDKSTYHAKMAMLCGHHTGYAEERLAKNLDRKKFYHQSLQLYNLILDKEGFHFSVSGCGNGIDWKKRRASVLAKMDKAKDSETDILFSDNEIAMIIKDTMEMYEEEKEAWEKRDRVLASFNYDMELYKKDQERKKQELIRYRQIGRLIAEAMASGDRMECVRLYKEKNELAKSLFGEGINPGGRPLSRVLYELENPKKESDSESGSCLFIILMVLLFMFLFWIFIG